MSLASVTNTALSGLSTATAQVEATAHNLANLQTAGFKSTRNVLATASPQPAPGGVTVVATSFDLLQGPIAVSDQPALLALDGEGLFILEAPSGERLYTRDGRFMLGSTGELLAPGGLRVLGHAADDDGVLDTSRLVPLRLDSAGLRSFTIRPDGRIAGLYSNGQQRTLGQLRLARFANPSGLAQRAGNTFRASPASGLPRESDPAAAGAATIVPAAVEQSNVEIGRELVELMQAEDQFRANLQVLDTAGTLLDEMFFPWRVR